MTLMFSSPLARSAQQRMFSLAKQYRFGLAVGLMVAGAAVLAAQAMGDYAPFMADDAVSAQTSSLAMTAGSVAGAPDQIPVSLSSQLPTHDATIGRLAGEGSTIGGAAGYRIPIVVPPGRHGIMPELSLSYNSRSGNGVAGIGWSLSAGSEIARCPATLDQDGTIAAVKLTAADKLCMDGQRLVASGGVYGQSGATYDTELRSFSRVTQLGGALNSATTYFKVESKDGDILYYGGSSTAASAARVIPGGATLPSSWLLERRQDRVGNLMRYAYTNMGNGESLLSSILYTGFGATDGTRHVDFSYEARPSTAGSNDIASSYLAGVVTLQTQRLKQISTYVGTQPVRKYVLRYDSVSSFSGRSLLRGVSDCGIAIGTATPVCHPETLLTWQEGTLKSQLHHFVAAGLPTGQEMEWMWQIGDIDGDGVSEMLAHYLDPTHQTGGKSYLLSLNADRTVRGVVDTSTLTGSFLRRQHIRWISIRTAVQMQWV